MEKDVDIFDNELPLNNKKKTKKRSVKPKKGTKENNKEPGSVEQEQRMEEALKHWKEAVATERGIMKRKRSVAHWDDRALVARVIKIRGSAFQTLGHTELATGTTCLLIHEAVYLVDQGQLEVWYKGLPLSLQQIQTLLVQTGFPISCYLVFAHLSRLGFIVRQPLIPFKPTSHSCALQLNLEVWRVKKAAFRRTAPPPPDFRVAVCDYKTDPPCFACIKATQDASVNIPFRFGIVDSATITFTTFFNPVNT